MCQKFISGIKEKEIALMFTKLCQQVEHNNIVAMLFVLYGLRPWCDEAARKLGIPRKQFEDDHITGKSFPPWLIKPFVWLLHAEFQDEWEKQSHELATEVLQKYLHSSLLDDIAISNLLEMPEAFSRTCEALFETQTLDDLTPSFKIEDTSSSALKVLVGNLAQHRSPSLQHQATLTLLAISFKVVENAVKIGSFPYALERLVGLLEEGMSPRAQVNAPWTLGMISTNVVENAVKIGSFPHAMERLVGLLDEGMTPKTQEYAAWTLGKISEDVVENAMKIGSFPHAVERLVRLLEEGMTPKAQECVAWTLLVISANVGWNAVKIGPFSYVVERLVGLLKREMSPKAQEYVAWTLGKFSENVLENAMKIGSFPHAMERLVGLLEEGMTPKAQEYAAWTLGKISEDVVENAMKIGSFPHAVERLVGLLEEGMSPQAQENAAWTLGVISANVVENAKKIGSFPHVMERLVGLLAKDGREYKFYTKILECMWILSYGVGENQLLLKRAFMEEPSSMDILASCARSKIQGNEHNQYLGAKVYLLVNIGNGEEIKYESSMAYVGQGDFKVMKEDYMGALADYENGLAIDKKDLLFCREWLHRTISFVKAKLGDFQGALADANEYVRITNNRSMGLQERGILRRLMGDWPGALADLDEGLGLETDDYEMLKHRGLVKFLLNDADGARADAEWALRVKPARVYCYSYGRGACFGESSVEYLGYKLK